MLPTLFPGIYQIWRHPLTRKKMPLRLKALKFTSSYAKLKYSEDENLVSKADWFPREHKDDCTHSVAYAKSCWFVLNRKVEPDAGGERGTVNDTLIILKSRFCFYSPSSVSRGFIISAEWYIPFCTTLELNSLSLTRLLFRNT